MSLEPIYTPINGLEAKKILKDTLIERINAIPLLKEGNAFKQIRLEIDFNMTCYPSDCPVPTAEFGVLIGLKEGDDIDFDAHVSQLDTLEIKRDKLLDKAKKITEFIEKRRMIIEETLVEEDTGIPDDLRLKHKLPVPMIQHSPTGKSTEVYVKPEDIAKAKTS